MRWVAMLLAFAVAGCTSTPPPAVRVASAVELGAATQPPLILGRDGGWGARLFDTEVFVFGDTFVTQAGADGSTLHSNSWSYTDQTSAASGLTLDERTDDYGSPVPLVPPTADEAAFNAAHASTGQRWALWAGATVWDAARDRALVSYGVVSAAPGAWNFSQIGQSIAVWSSWEAQAERPVLNDCPASPTLLFCEDDGTWADSLVAVGDDLYGFDCENDGFSSRCRLGRVPLAAALDKSSWQAWDGKSFGPLAGATTLFEGGLNMRVFFDAYAGAWLAVYSLPFSNDVTYRTAPELTGPWSSAATLFVANNPSSTYDAYVQPDYSEDDGKTVYVTFSRSTSEFGSELVLEKITFE